MSKSRRQRARERKVVALRLKIESMAEDMEAWRFKSAAMQEIDRVRAERLRNIFTPEYMQEMDASHERLAKISHQMSTWNGILQSRLRQYRPSGLGSYRTKRLRKKMATQSLAKGER